MATRPSILFLIRDKLGDSLIAANVALLFARRHPEWQVSVMVRDACAHALAHEPELRLIPYRSGAGARLLTWWWRLSGRRFDVLGVMRGFGDRTVALVRRIPARRVIVHDQRLAAVASEVAPIAAAGIGEDPHYGPAWRVARLVDATLPEPDRLHFPGLAARWQTTAKRYVAVCPLSDERRRNIPAAALELLYADLRRRHPDHEVLVLVREQDELKALARLPNVPVKSFHEMPTLIELLLQSSHYYGTDTGLLHLAAAMNMPSTVFFGPTQPHRVMAPGQSNVVALRAPILGERHCDIKACTSAVCIAQAVVNFAGADGKGVVEPELPDCPLRA